LKNYEKMKKIKQIVPYIFLLLFMTYSWSQEKVIKIDASGKTHKASIKLNGANIEDLNFQTYGGVYSQLLYGQDFEEHIDVDFLNLSTKSEYINSADPVEAMMVGPARYGTYVVLDENSKPYITKVAFSVGINAMEYPVKRTYEFESKKPEHLWFINKDLEVFPVDSLPVFQKKLILDKINSDEVISRFWRKVNFGNAKGKYSLVTKNTFNGRRDQLMQFVSGKGEVGLDNMGVLRMGINFQKGKNYEGLLRVKNKKALTLYVALLNANGTVKLIEKAIPIKASPDSFQKIEFELTPSKSDTKGRFAIILKEPGEITLGHAFLQPGKWGRVKDYPIRKDFVDQMKANGISFLRYNGSMNTCKDSLLYSWKNMIGPRDERKAYTASFIPYSTYGFGFFEALKLGESAGVDVVLGISKDEDPAGIKDMLEYTNGPATSKWGAKRAQDGHTAPYNLRHIEISNEQLSKGKQGLEYFARFKELATEIWKVDPKMNLIVSLNIPQHTFLNKVVPGDPNNKNYNRIKEFLMWIKEQGKEEQFGWDSHYSGRLEEGKETYSALGLVFQDIVAKDFGFKLKLYPLEENGSNHDFLRGLGHALKQNRLNRWGDRLEAAATANLFQPENAYTAFSQGRIFYDSNKFWNQASGHIDQMYTKEWLPVVLDTNEEPNGTFDVLVKMSENKKVMAMYVVNYGAESQTRNLEIAGFVPADQATVTQLGPYPLESRNSAENPNFIKPVTTNQKIGGNGLKHEFPGNSFTVIRFKAK
jgi:alpha-N-arabinofuranosidase